MNTTTEDAAQIRAYNDRTQTVEIVCAYLHNRPPADLDELTTTITQVHATIAALGTVAAPTPVEELKPAVPIRKSITPDHIICLEDGKQFRSLKRHIRTHYNLSPEEYREKWGLPQDYPMVAPNYSAVRSQLAKNTGLGKRVAA